MPGIQRNIGVGLVRQGTNSTPSPPDTEILSSGYWDDNGIWNDENPDILNTAQ